MDRSWYYFLCRKLKPHRCKQAINIPPQRRGYMLWYTPSVWGLSTNESVSYKWTSGQYKIFDSLDGYTGECRPCALRGTFEIESTECRQQSTWARITIQTVKYRFCPDKSHQILLLSPLCRMAHWYTVNRLLSCKNRSMQNHAWNFDLSLQLSRVWFWNKCPTF